MRQALLLELELASAVAAAVGQMSFNASPKARGKTGVGHLIEYYLGRRPNNKPEPDIEELGVEVKAIPLKRSGASWVPKEPTSLAMIDYGELDRQPWPDASVQKKLRRILFVPFEHHYEDKRLHRFRRPFLWSPEPIDAPVMHDDYDAVRRYVREGRAHELSETISTILGARRKGSKGQMARQPNSEIPAKSRAWALKTAFTGTVVGKHVLGHRTVSVTSVEDIRSLADVLPWTIHRIGAYEGRTLESIAEETGAKVSGGKAGPASFVRALLGIRAKGSIEEFDKLGVRIHTISVRPDGKLNEAVPFPAMDLRAFAQEEWEDAELREHVDRILFIPLISEAGVSRGARTIGKPFLWVPSQAEWATIEEEWRSFQAQVRTGAATYQAHGARRQSGLTPSSQTSILHMRPHARDSRDLDVDPRGTPVTKQSFWLNKAFVAHVGETG